MNATLYISVEVESCRAAGHHLKLTWSDNSPLKVSLMCVTCSVETKLNAYTAYGVEAGSFGAWRRPRIGDFINDQSGRVMEVKGFRRSGKETQS